jgi:Putative Ig domain
VFRKVGSALLAVMAVLVIVGVGGFVLAAATGIDLNSSSGSHAPSSGSHARLADQDLVQAPVAEGSGFVPAAPTFTADSPPTTDIVGAPYTYTFAASGSPAPTFSVNSGSLPNGLTLDSTTGTLSGTPTKAGGFTFTIEAANGVTPAAVSPSITITVTAQTICARRATIPAGYVVTALVPNYPSCGADNFLGFNAYQLSKAAAGDVICWGTEFEPPEAVPVGYVATAMLDAPQCGRGINVAGVNAYRISAVAAGDVICWGTAFEPVEPVPAGYVKSATLDAPQCGRGVNFAGVNAYRISAS